MIALETDCLRADSGPHPVRIRWFLRPRGTPELFSGEGVLDHSDHPEEVLLGHLCAGFDPHSVAQNCEDFADESTWWCAGFGVLPSQRRTILGRPVGLSDRAHQVFVTAAQGHPPDGTVIVSRSQFVL